MVSVYSPISPVEGQSLSQSHSGAMSIPLRRPDIYIYVSHPNAICLHGPCHGAYMAAVGMGMQSPMDHMQQLHAVPYRQHTWWQRVQVLPLTAKESG